MTILSEMTWIYFFPKAKLLRSTGSLLECTMRIIDKSEVDITKKTQLFWIEMSVGEINYFEIKWILNSWC